MGYELTRLKETQLTVGLEVRWVNSQAMLASLPKRGEDQQMHRFVACRQCWTIVDDPEMFSGRKLQKLGRDSLGLDEVQQTNDQCDKNGMPLHPIEHSEHSQVQ